MLELTLPALFAVFIWWFSTGLILLLDGLPRTTFRWSVLISSVVALSALVGLVHTADQTSVAGAYCAFTCALLVWGWHELTFLTGWLTGPRKHAGVAEARGWQRFSQAVAAILWHEMAILASGAVIVAITWNQPNQVGTWTFVVLWVMRTSAKLNLFFGVRNLSEEFLPPHLAYLESFFRRRAMNWLFPFCIAGSTAVLVWLVMRAVDPAASEVTTTGLILVATILAMAIVEHWLLVLPFKATALWRWAMRNRPEHAQNPASTTECERSTDEKLLHAR